MSAYFRSPQTAAYFSDPTTYSDSSPLFSIDSVSGGDQPNESWVFALSTSSGSGMTANIGGTALTVTDQNLDSITVTIPDLLTFSGGIYRFSESLTVEVIDGVSSATIDVQVIPVDGYVQFIVPDPIPEVFTSTEFTNALAPQVLEIGDYIYCSAPVGSDPENGIFPDDSIISYRIMDVSDVTPVWGSEGIVTVNPTQSYLNKAFDDVTLSASGDVNLVASLNRTLQNVAPSITGNTLIDGSLGVNLGNIIPITSGAIRVVGVLNSSLEDVVLFSSQINTAVFTGAVEDVESSISGEVYLNGSLNRTLERVNISATTELIINSSLSKILDNVDVTSSATVTVEGSLSETLDDTIIFTGAVVVGSSTIQLQDVEISINAESLTIANLDEVIDQVIQASSGDVLLDGTINEVLDSIQISTDGEITLSGDLLGTVEDVRIATSSVPEIVTVITYLVYLFDSYTRG